MSSDDIRYVLSIIVVILLYLYIIGAMLFAVISYEFGLCFITGRSYSGKLYSLDKKLIARRRKVLVNELLRDPYFPKLRSIFPGLKKPISMYTRKFDHIFISSMTAVTVLYVLPTLGLFYVLFPGLWRGSAIVLVSFVGFVLAMYRTVKPLGKLRPKWMDQYLEK